MDVVNQLYWYTDEVLRWGLIALRAWAFFDCLMRKSAAFPAVDKLTKPAWLGITGGACALLLLNLVVPGSMLFYLIGLVAVLVYLVDVKPAVTEVQRGPRW